MTPTEKWCAECGVRIRAEGSHDPIPLSVWTGHIHKPIPGEVMRAASGVWAIAVTLSEGNDDDEGLENVRCLLKCAGIAEQAVEMANELIVKELIAEQVGGGQGA